MLYICRRGPNLLVKCVYNNCCQILDDLKASMHYQIKYEYNATATYSNRTDTDVHRITTAWDTLQVQVRTTRII